MQRKIISVALFAALAAPALSHAHVTLQPEEVPAAGFERLDVRVPNERDDSSTVKIEVQFPDGFIFVSTEPVPGWSAEVNREKLPEPVEVFGEEQTEQVASVTFTADGEGVGPGQFQDFGLSVGLPDAPGEELVFESLQTYEDGEVVRWIGPADSEEPAPIVALTEAEGDEAAHGESGDEEVTAEADDAAVSEDDGSGDGLAIAALIVGGLGLLLGGYAAARSRR